MAATKYGDMGDKVKLFREALGYQKRPDFAALFPMTAGRLQSIEQGRQKMNQDDFKVIYKKWPWALGYLLDDEPLEIPSKNHSSADKSASSLTKEEVETMIDTRVKELLLKAFETETVSD